MREDYVADLETLIPLLPSLAGRNRLRLRPMSRAQAFDAVARPGAQVLSAAVAQEIVDALGYTRRSARPAADDRHTGNDVGEVEPILLSLVCRELNELRRQRGLTTISSELVRSAQGVDSILRVFYERCFDGLAHSARVFVEDKLVGRSGYRQMVALDDLRESPGLAGAVQTLVQRRLLRIEDDRLGVPRVELSHDILTPLVVSARNQRFLQDEAARVLAERRAARRRQFQTAIAVLLVLAIGGQAVALWQWRQAMAARGQEAVARTDLESALADAKLRLAAAEKSQQAAQTAQDALKTALAELQARRVPPRPSAGVPITAEPAQAGGTERPAPARPPVSSATTTRLQQLLDKSTAELAAARRISTNSSAKQSTLLEILGRRVEQLAALLRLALALLRASGFSLSTRGYPRAKPSCAS
jgi:hypothetical protein